jgi:hypothetical protein
MTTLERFNKPLGYSPSTSDEVLILKLARTIEDTSNAHTYLSMAQKHNLAAMLSALKTVLDGPTNTRAQRFRDLFPNP